MLVSHSPLTYCAHSKKHLRTSPSSSTVQPPPFLSVSKVCPWNKREVRGLFLSHFWPNKRSEITVHYKILCLTTASHHPEHSYFCHKLDLKSLICFWTEFYQFICWHKVHTGRRSLSASLHTITGMNNQPERREEANSQLEIKSLQAMDPFMIANNPVKAELT